MASHHKNAHFNVSGEILANSSSPDTFYCTVFKYPPRTRHIARCFHTSYLIGIIFPNNLGRILFPFADENLKLKEKKYLSKVTQLVSRKDSYPGLFDSKVHLFVVSHSSPSWLKEHGFLCGLNKRTDLSMCLSGGQGSGFQTRKPGQSQLVTPLSFPDCSERSPF